MTPATDGKLDPRICNTALDAMVLDRCGGPRDALVDRLQKLHAEDLISLIEPDPAYRQTQHPNTPTEVRRVNADQIYSLSTELTADERQHANQIRSMLRGNSTTSQHDADATILFEATKYACGYLITEDKRLLKIQAAPPLSIVTLADFLRIYDSFVERDISN